MNAALAVRKNESFSGVIDFNRCDWGDPIHEFLKLGHFSSEISIPFSIGQIRGYFNGKDPDVEFWQLYSLHLAISLTSFIAWTKAVNPSEMPRTMNIIERVLEDHDFFEKIVPKWYLENA